MIYFDNAATTFKKPATVINATMYALTKLSANPGRGSHKLSIAAAEQIYNTRKAVAELFNANSENVIFTSGCTHSINTVLKGVLNEGDHIVISSLEHNAVVRPLTAMKADHTTAKVSLLDDDETVSNFEKAIKPNTKMIFCTAASNVTGKILPIEKIALLCKKRGLLFGLDAAQGAGVISIDMEKMGIDYLCIAPHKGLYAPMGVGILIARAPIKKTLIEGGTGSNSLSEIQPISFPDGFESGTPNLSGIIGTLKGVEFVKNRGIDEIYNHEIRLTQYVYKHLQKNPSVILYTPFPQKDMYVGVLPFNIKGKSSEETALYLNENGIAVRGGYHCAPLAHRQLNTLDIGAVRLSFSRFNSYFEADKLFGVLERKNIKNI